MSFTHRIPPNELAGYSQIADFNIFIQGELQKPNPVKSFGGSLLIREKIFTAPIEFPSNDASGLRFVNCFFKEDVLFFNSVWDVNLSFNQCFFDKRLTLNGNKTKFNSELNFVEVAVGIQFLVIQGEYSDCKWTFNENTTVNISGGTFQKLNIGYWGGANMKSVWIDFEKVAGNIKVTGANTKIEELHFSHHSPNSSIAIEDINVNCLSIYRYRNIDGLRIWNLKSMKMDGLPTELSIAESYLGKAEFYSVDLGSFAKVNIFNSHLADCSFVNVRWSATIGSFKGRRIYREDEDIKVESMIKRIENPSPVYDAEAEQFKVDEKVLAYYWNQRETYRQIKYALSKQGDVVNEQKFHSLEMRAHDRSITFEKDPGTKLIIGFSNVFSDFGLSMLRPFIGLVTIHWFLFAILIVIFNYHDLSFSIVHASISGFETAFSEYFRLMNPLRRNENEFMGYSTIIDIAMRVWSSFMIYNFVRATRRFIK